MARFPFIKRRELSSYEAGACASRARDEYLTLPVWVLLTTFSPPLIIEEAQMEEQVIEKPVATAAATSDEPEATAPTMSAPLRRELESMDRSTKVKARLAPKPAKADRRKSPEARKILEEARAQQAKTNKASAKEVKVNRLVQGSGARRKGKRSGCGAGSFCRVSE